jgi:hypothetical protein
VRVSRVLAIGEVAWPASPATAPPPQQATGSRAGAIRQWCAGETMLIRRATPSTSVRGAGRRVPSHSRQFGHRGTAPRFFVLPLNELPWSIHPLLRAFGDLPRLLSSTEARAIGALPRAPPGLSRGLATSQTMDGSPSLRRRHRAAVRSSWAGFLHTRPLVSSLYRTAFDRRNLSANQPLFLRIVPQQ